MSAPMATRRNSLEVSAVPERLIGYAALITSTGLFFLACDWILRVRGY